MNVALIIPCFNRPEYLRQCIWAINNSDLSKINEVLFIDDKSTDTDTIKQLQDIDAKFTNQHVRWNDANLGIKQNLLWAYDHYFKNHYDFVINIDSDAIVRNDFVVRLLEIYKAGLDGCLLTGFNCKTKNANGSERHPIIYSGEYFHFKKSVGGINFCVDQEAYEKHLKPALLQPVGNFDHIACINSGGSYCLKESVIQHIGFDSSMGHTEHPDVADDFYYWDLPNVTLLGVDSNAQRLNVAKDKCTKWIKFGDVVTLNPDIRSKEAYSEYIIKQAYKHIYTSHVLIFQHDGFVHNWQAWDNGWLQYDYIGAPWWHNDGMDVGNGGFSLRSKRLMEIVANDTHITQLHPEDHHICRTYRPYLESKYGVRFAPLEVAEKFSYEGYRQPGKYLDKQFGVHGARNMKAKTGRKYVFNQFLSLGDILFLVPLYRALVDEGNQVLWPIDAIYLPIKKHFPDVNFVDKARYNLPYDYTGMCDTEFGRMIPYRFASELMGRTLHKCMESKYELYGHDFMMWRELTYVRDKAAEARLIKVVGASGKFNLVNRTFGHEAKHTIEPVIANKHKVIEMRNIEGYTLIDWLGVVELATEVHASNSSLNYLIELMDLKVPVYLYPRGIWGETGFEYTRALWRNECFIFVL